MDKSVGIGSSATKRKATAIEVPDVNRFLERYQSSYTGGERQQGRHDSVPRSQNFNKKKLHFEAISQASNHSGAGEASRPKHQRPTGRVKKLERTPSNTRRLSLIKSPVHTPKTPKSKAKSIDLSSGSSGKSLAKRTGARASDFTEGASKGTPTGDMGRESAKHLSPGAARTSGNTGKGDGDVMQIDSDPSSEDETAVSEKTRPAAACDTSPTPTSRRTEHMAPAVSQIISPRKPSNLSSMIGGFNSSYTQGPPRLTSLNSPASFRMPPAKSPGSKGFATSEKPTLRSFASVVSSLKSKSGKGIEPLTNGGKGADDDDDFSNVLSSHRREQDKARRAETNNMHGNQFTVTEALRHGPAATSRIINSLKIPKRQISMLTKQASSIGTGRRPSKSSVGANPPRGPFVLKSVQFGKYHQSNNSVCGKPEGEGLKLVYRLEPKRLEITGIDDGALVSPYTTLNDGDIRSIEYGEFGGSGIMRIGPNNTMETIFSPNIFDPSSDDPSLSRILVCWSLSDKGRACTIKSIIQDMQAHVEVSQLSVADCKSCLDDLIRPESIDLLSSDDEHVDVEKPFDSGSTRPSLIPQTFPPLGPEEIRQRRRTLAQKVLFANAIDDKVGLQSPTRGRRKTMAPSSVAAGTSAYARQSLSRYNLRKGEACNMAETSSADEIEFKEIRSPDEESDDLVELRRKYRSAGHVHLFEYPADGHKRISVTGFDICRLFKDEFLNDTIIDFYMRYTSENLRQSNPELYEQCFFFNTFFFRKLLHLKKSVSTDSGDDSIPAEYEQLMKWTASANLFDRRYVFIPINENIHWYLVIITNPHLLLKSATVSESSKRTADQPEGAKSEYAKSSASDNSAHSNSSSKDKVDDGNKDGIAQEQEQEKEELPDEALVACMPPRSQRYRADTSDKRLFRRIGQETHNDAACFINANTAHSGSSVLIESSDKATRDIASSPVLSTVQLGSMCADASSAVDDEDSVFSGADKVRIRKHSSSSSALRSDIIDLCSPQHTKAPVSGDVVVDATGAQEKDSEAVLLRFMDKEVQVPESRYVDPLEKPSILILDSLGNKHQRTITLLRSYLKAEAISRHNVVPSVVPTGKYVKVPLQGNLCDCGVFLLNYIERFLTQPREITELALNGVDLRKWFVPATMKDKRKDIFMLASGLAEEHDRKKEQQKPLHDASARDKPDKDQEVASKDDQDRSDSGHVSSGNQVYIGHTKSSIRNSLLRNAAAAQTDDCSISEFD